MKELIGKKVRIIIATLDTTVPVEGVVKEANNWIVLDVKGKVKAINKDAVLYVEEK